MADKETVHVEWTTTVEEYYSADIDIDVWALLTTQSDEYKQGELLASFEVEENHHGDGVTDRTVMGVEIPD